MAITAERSRTQRPAGTSNRLAVCLSGGSGTYEAAWRAGVRPPLVTADVTDEPVQHAIEFHHALIAAHGARRRIVVVGAADQAKQGGSDDGQDRHSESFSDQPAALTIRETQQSHNRNNNRRQPTMTTTPTHDQLMEFARRGAAAQLAAIQAERLAILAAFPNLAPNVAPLLADAGRVNGTGERRRRPPMSAKQRQAVGRRMKAYWKARRQAAAAWAAAIAPNARRTAKRP